MNGPPDTLGLAQQDSVPLGPQFNPAPGPAPTQLGRVTQADPLQIRLAHSASDEHAAHVPLLHNALAQSFATPHPKPFLQDPHGPPQSTSVSPPFCFPSPQLAGTQCPLPQTPLVQSPPSAQPFVSPHGEHFPPQSTSVSSPLWT